MDYENEINEHMEVDSHFRKGFPQGLRTLYHFHRLQMKFIIVQWLINGRIEKRVSKLVAIDC